MISSLWGLKDIHKDCQTQYAGDVKELALTTILASFLVTSQLRKEFLGVTSDLHCCLGADMLCRQQKADSKGLIKPSWQM